MNNECGARYFDATGLGHTCNLVRNHEGSHYDYRYRRTWPAARKYSDWFQSEYKTGVLGQFPEEETVVLKLTLTDLKTIAYYMAEEEDADPTKIKIDEALKEML